MKTREHWLADASELLLTELIQPATLAPLPARPYKVACGFPATGRLDATGGQCWPSQASDSGTNELFISPTIDDPHTVLHILTHELTHYLDDCVSGHKAHFARIAKQLGFLTPLTHLHPSPQLIADCSQLLQCLPPYPHQKINPQKSLHKKQPQKMHKVFCDSCQFLFRASRMQINRLPPAPRCPCCDYQTLAVS